MNLKKTTLCFSMTLAVLFNVNNTALIKTEAATIRNSIITDFITSLKEGKNNAVVDDETDEAASGKVYITYNCSNKKIKIDKGSSSSKIYTKYPVKFTIKAEFTDTDEGSTLYYQLADKGDPYSNDNWKKARKSAVGLITKKNHSFYITKNMDNKVVYIKAVCKNKKNIFKTVPFTVDTKKPTITGIKNRVTYTKKVTIKFSDAISGVKKATLNGRTIKNGKSVKKTGDYKLIVTDKAGNKRTLTFKIRK